MCHKHIQRLFYHNILFIFNSVTCTARPEHKFHVGFNNHHTYISINCWLDIDWVCLDQQICDKKDIFYKTLLMLLVLFFMSFPVNKASVNEYTPCGQKYWVTPLSIQNEVFSVSLQKVHKIKHLTMQPAFTNICERMVSCKEHTSPNMALIVL